NNTNNLTPPEKLPNIKHWHLFNCKKLYELYNKEWNFFIKYKNNKDYNPNEHKPLTDKEIEEKKELLKEGFIEIGYNDFSKFIRLCIKYGRDDINNILNNMLNESNIDNKDLIIKYHKAFFNKAPQITELQTYLDR